MTDLQTAPTAQNAEPAKPAVLTIRNARMGDIPGISALVARVYKDMPPYTAGMLRGQIATYPDGQFVVEFEGEIVGYAASFRIDEKSVPARRRIGPGAAALQRRLAAAGVQAQGAEFADLQLPV